MTFITNNIEVISGLTTTTITATTITATTITGGTFFGDGGELYNIPNDYVTGTTWNSSGNTLTLHRNDGFEINQLINITNIDGDLTISGKTVGDSSFKTWAQWYRNDNTIFTITPSSTPTKVGVQFTGDTISPNTKGFTYSAGTLTFIGSESMQQFHLTISMSVLSSANNQLYEFWVTNNGVKLNNIVIANELSPKAESVSLTGIVELLPNDYIELYTINNTANKDILFRDINFSIIQI